MGEAHDPASGLSREVVDVTAAVRQAAQDGDGPRPAILQVDDDVLHRLAVGQGMDAFSVVHCTSLRELGATLMSPAGRQWECAVVDLDLGKDAAGNRELGLSAVRMLRAAAPTMSVPIVLYTAPLDDVRDLTAVLCAELYGSPLLWLDKSDPSAPPTLARFIKFSIDARKLGMRYMPAPDTATVVAPVSVLLSANSTMPLGRILVGSDWQLEFWKTLQYSGDLRAAHARAFDRYDGRPTLIDTNFKEFTTRGKFTRACRAVFDHVSRPEGRLAALHGTPLAAAPSGTGHAMQLLAARYGDVLTNIDAYEEPQ